MVIILNCRFTTAIAYHDFLHGFLVGRGMGTATLEVKLLKHVAVLREAVLCATFLKLHKVYDALDRSRSMSILEGYGVGDNYLRLLPRFWERLNMVARAPAPPYSVSPKTLGGGEGNCPPHHNPPVYSWTWTCPRRRKPCVVSGRLHREPPPSIPQHA